VPKTREKFEHLIASFYVSGLSKSINGNMEC
jgi:hypothetical protein